MNSQLGLSLPPSLLKENRTNLVLLNSMLVSERMGGAGAAKYQGHTGGGHPEQSTLVMTLPLSNTVLC